MGQVDCAFRQVERVTVPVKGGLRLHKGAEERVSRREVRGCDIVPPHFPLIHRPHTGAEGLRQQLCAEADAQHRNLTLQRGLDALHLDPEVRVQFGLVGHLLEMTKASQVDAVIERDALPLLDGALATVEAGILSSLQPQNLRLRRGIRDIEQASHHPVYPLLFDPQTAGGLLAGVPADRAADCVEALHRCGYPDAAVIEVSSGRYAPYAMIAPMPILSVKNACPSAARTLPQVNLSQDGVNMNSTPAMK